MGKIKMKYKTAVMKDLRTKEVIADGDEYTFQFEMLDPEGRPVTVTHNAIWVSE